MEEKAIDRRKFTLAAALAALSGVVITISSCGSDSSPTAPPTPTPTPAAGDKTAGISGNHGHTAVITAAQLTAGGGLTLEIQGSSTHPHSVQLSAAEVVSIAANQQVAKESTNNSGHTHTVTFN